MTIGLATVVQPVPITTSVSTSTVSRIFPKTATESAQYIWVERFFGSRSTTGPRFGYGRT
ncbi:hypothetical protein [Streptomyces sp. NBC_00893]|uniref:hypothetical protein n=1 Tax=Streptomyces sp. NBC_00893 TaxID=2975862 RepID=UPI00224D4624|nr:hypothetical protein [Streptomyces sp. NBC_00893]MCX4851705.1 hypothetical protein [Streptomyces sp. NBC_00893]